MAQTISVKAQLIDEMSADIRRIQRTVDRSFTRMGKKADQTSAKMQNMKNASLALKAGIAGIAAFIGGKLVKAFAKAGSEMENLTTEFRVLLGTQELAIERMKELEQFAQTTPFQLTQVAKASKILETFTKGALSTGEALRMVGDAAAITAEKDFAGLAMWVGRAYDGLQNNRPVGEAMMRLQELALVSGEARGAIEALQKQGRGKEAWLVLEQQLMKANGGMKELSKTVTGLTSTFKDQLAASMRQLLEGGVWEGTQNALESLTETMNKLLNSGALKKVGMGLSLLLNPIKALKINLAGLGLFVNKSLMGLMTVIENAVEGMQDMLFKLAALPGPAGSAARALLAETNIIAAGVARDRARIASDIDVMQTKLQELAQSVAGGKEAAADERSGAKEDTFKKNLVLMKEAADKEVEIVKKKNAIIEDSEAMRVRQNLGATQQLIRSSGGMAKAMIGDTKELQGVLAALSFMEIMAAGAVATRAIWQDSTTGTVYQKIAMSIAQGAQMTAQAIGVAASIRGQGFQNGGIVPGNQTQGDRVGVRVNSGEMVLNMQQQSMLFEAINRGGMGGGVTINMNNTLPEGISREDAEGFSVATLTRLRDGIRELQSTGQI